MTATKSEWNLPDNPSGSVAQIKVIINPMGLFCLKTTRDLLWLALQNRYRETSNYKPTDKVVYRLVEGKHTDTENRD